MSSSCEWFGNLACSQCAISSASISVAASSVSIEDRIASARRSSGELSLADIVIALKRPAARLVHHLVSAERRLGAGRAGRSFREHRARRRRRPARAVCFSSFSGLKWDRQALTIIKKQASLRTAPSHPGSSKKVKDDAQIIRNDCTAPAAELGRGQERADDGGSAQSPRPHLPALPSDREPVSGADQ